MPTSDKVKSGFLKNKGSFYFTVNKQNEVKNSNQPTVASDDKKLRIFLNGVIYNNNARQLIDGFLSQGVDYIKQVEGSFVIFLINDKQFHIFTDKVNSKKAYYAYIDDIWYVSNDIDALPKHKCEISLTGLACLLASGHILNDLTLFEEIRSIKRATVNSFKNGEMSSYRYWDFQFSYSSTPDIQVEEYQRELELLLIESVKRCYASSSNPAVSLSAGHDSRTILGILHKEIKAKDISCFSYALTEDPDDNTDAYISKEIAAKCGYPHQILGSYNGNLIEHLEDNAREGKGTSLCIELDTWHNLAASNQFSDIFVGDIFFGHQINSKEEYLEYYFMRGSIAIKSLGNFISRDIYNQMCHCLENLFDEIVQPIKEIQELQDYCDYIKLDQFLPNFRLPWREYFCSQAGYVHNPFLDGDILEFMKKVPPQFRQDYFLYRKTIINMLPELFSIDLAPSSGFTPDWQAELQKHKDQLIAYIQGTDSRLDDIISKKEILKALEQKISLVQKAKAFPWRAINSIRRRNKYADKFLNIFFGPRVLRHVKPVDLLLRLLVIRIYLSPPF